MVEQRELARRERGDLARQLGADRAAGAGDQDALVAEEVAHLVHVEHDRLAAEQVLDAHVAHLRERGAPLLQVGQAG